MFRVKATDHRLDNNDDEYYIDGAHETIAELAEGRISLRLDVWWWYLRCGVCVDNDVRGVKGVETSERRDLVAFLLLKLLKIYA